MWVRIILSSIVILVLSRPVTAQTTSVADVYENVRTSVVELRTIDRALSKERGNTLATVRGIGSGVIIGDGHLILTAAHVVQVSDAIVVRFADGSTTSARVIGSDHVADVALLRIAAALPDGVHPVTLADSSTTRIGERVLVVGAPLGLSNTLSVGYLSARRAGVSTIPSLVDAVLLQTDAAINQGNSGGPMFNMDGNVIGLVSHLVTRTGDNSGLGFAVSSNTARELLLDRPAFWSGGQSTLITGELARALNTPGGRPGYLVERVATDSPVESLGLRAGTLLVTIDGKERTLGGDIILSIMGITVGAEENHEQIRLRLSELKPGDEISVEILRDGRVQTLTGRRGSN